MNRFIISLFFLPLLLLSFSGCDQTPSRSTDPDCTPLTCEDAGYECGPLEDGCGNTLECGDCPGTGEFCGGRGVAGQCGRPSSGCIPRTCDEIGDFCGPMPDGCGDFVECVVCQNPETCGGGGIPSRCGIATEAPPCEPIDCGAQNIGCGWAGDGCGDKIFCGDCEVEGEYCGAGGVPSQCGAPECTKITCRDQGIDCGWASDGCGKVIFCGDCPRGHICGAGGTPGKCFEPTCDPLGCADQNIGCGLAGDGCGGTIDCGSCTAPQTCGGGGIPSQCGIAQAGACVTLSCADQNIECGLAGDGCGGTIDCGFCTTPGETCGGGGRHSRCGSPGCTPWTCTELGVACGMAGDGCGGTQFCGDCPDGETCGGGGVPSQCGAPPCIPQDCATLGIECGWIGDGCGNRLFCGDCVTGEYCGGGAVPGQCGSPTCTTRTAADCSVLGVECGPISDGCGGTIDCGGCSNPGESCGGGGVSGQCGFAPCTPLTSQDCAGLGIGCGPASDGCGGTIDCGSCSNQAESCGGGGVPGQCGSAPCTPRTAADCATIGIECGAASDGCGGTINCGNCPSGQICGAISPSQCDAPDCTPLTCTDTGANCGRVSDGCGGLTDDCGTCSPPEFCGGGGPNVCGEDPSGECVGLCPYQVSCPAGQETRLTGRVWTPSGQDPIYNAVVFVPNGPLPSIPDDGAACERCEDQDFGDILVATVTDSEGYFDLRNVPAGIDFPLVVQVGKWRREVTIPALGPCQARALGVNDARLPRNSTEGNIPRTAISTGRIDGLECVLYKAGVDVGEFTHPLEDGRIHLYRANGAWPSLALYNQCRDPHDLTVCTDRSPGGCPAAYPICRDILADRLYDDPSVLNSYDVVIFGCERSRQERLASVRNNILNYVNSGGRLFLSHWSFDWVFHYTGADPSNPDSITYETDPLNTTCDWSSGHFDGGFDRTLTPYPGCSPPCESEAFVDTSFERGFSFSQWLDFVGASNPSSGLVTIFEPRAHCHSAINSGRRWIYTQKPTHDATSVQQLTFNTPVGASDDDICGRVVYSAFHVTIGETGNKYFPQHCDDSGPLTDQEKILLFMFFDLAACISDDYDIVPPCKLRTCQDVGANCGWIGDGCGGTIYCGDCTAPDTCGGGGTPNICGSSCIPQTCSHHNAECGYVSDGCGDSIYCGNCTVAGETCGGSGTSNQCGLICNPRDCADYNAECGYIPDGCGASIYCGDCTVPGETCGGGGISNQCGGECIPLTCQDLGAQCGLIGDGCGSSIDCGVCTVPGETCGGGGIPNVCGGACVPYQCETNKCGLMPDGCGETVDCGDCPPGLFCGGDGAPNECGGECSPISCQPNQCGEVSDGCGRNIDCGDCPPGVTCGGGGIPNICGNDCMNTTCVDFGAECGVIPDGCGGSLDCGDCPPGYFCGGDGVPYQCGTGCARLTCADYPGVECGAVPDGCGGYLDCGDCPPGKHCGVDGVPNVCGGGCTVKQCGPDQCGMVPDGCGFVMDCGDCPPGLICGGGGIPNICGNPCDPINCNDVGAECGYISDGCGESIYCGDCPPGLFCGVGGEPNVCAFDCTPQTCEESGAECGIVPDGCGDVMECGSCPSGFHCENINGTNRCVQIG